MFLTQAELSTDPSVMRLDRFVRFEPRVAACYEAEHGAERVRALRQAIVVGLVFYNAYNLTSIMLMPDILGLAVAVRLMVRILISVAVRPGIPFSCLTVHG